MHPDRKVGFAMGILLVGVVAALFFRNEPLLIDEMPVVNREGELNERLRERDVAVYLSDDASPADGATPPDSGTQPRHAWTLREFFSELEERNSGVPAPVGRQSEPANPKSAKSVTAKAANVKSVVVGGGEAESGSRFAAPIDEPATILETLSEPSTSLADFDELLHTAANDPATPTIGTKLVPAGEFDEYTVRYGDTLSGIAERFLGSQQKYGVLFEANRDRLPSPDRLRVGSAIRIPRPVH